MNPFLNYLSALWQIMLDLSLWLFVGALIAGLLKIFLPKGFVKRHAGNGRFSSIVKTSLLGVPLPLCSCGVLPATIGIKKDGAGNGAAVGFLISTPQTGVDSILVTASFLGWPLALFKVLAAFITGLLGGFAVQATEPRKTANEPTDHSPEHATASATKRWRTFWDFTVNELIGGIYQYLAAGLLVAALITVLFPADSFKDVAALQGIWGMLVMLLIATPLYVCTTGSVPIAASLIAAGLPVGSALVFLMAGPATNAATMAAVLKQFGKRVTAIYLGTVILGSVGFGLLFQNFGASLMPSVSVMHHVHANPLMTILNTVAATGLVALLGFWAFRDLAAWMKKRRAASNPSDERLQLQVANMTCKNCAAKVTQAAMCDSHVAAASVDLDSGRLLVEGHGIDPETIIRCVMDAGYPAQRIQEEA